MASLLRRWCSLEPNCTLFSLPTPAGQFVGASPELLVERTADHVRSRPLAGTTDRFPDADSTLPAGPARLGQGHRGAPLRGRRHLSGAWHHGARTSTCRTILSWSTCTTSPTWAPPSRAPCDTRPDASPPGALHLAALLHPTPAVGGVPSGPGPAPDRPAGGRPPRALCGPGRLCRRRRRRPVRRRHPGHDGGRPDGHADRRRRCRGRLGPETELRRDLAQIRRGVRRPGPRRPLHTAAPPIGWREYTSAVERRPSP